MESNGDHVIRLNNFYYDLPAGRSIKVTCPLPPGWTVEQARAALKIRSIYDAYAHDKRGC